MWFETGPTIYPARFYGVSTRMLTPPGSGCSIHLSTGIINMPPGVLEGLQVVVSDIEAARAQLVERGVEASPVQHIDDGAWVDGRGREWNSFVFFSDPDGNAGFCRSAQLAISRAHHRR